MPLYALRFLHGYTLMALSPRAKAQSRNAKANAKAIQVRQCKAITLQGNMMQTRRPCAQYPPVGVYPGARMSLCTAPLEKFSGQQPQSPLILTLRIGCRACMGLSGALWAYGSTGSLVLMELLGGGVSGYGFGVESVWWASGKAW
jgi:hypothetical protein